MKIEKVKIKRVKEYSIEKLVCDFCFKTSTDPDSSDITSFSIAPGYGSIFDGDVYEFDICDKCLKELKSKINK